MSSDELEKWLEVNDMKNQVVDGFWEYMKNYKESNPYDYVSNLNWSDLECINFKIHMVSHGLILVDGNKSEYIYVFLRIYFYENLIGTYKAVFTLDAEYADDFLNFEDQNYIQRLVAIEDRNTEIATIAIKEGVSNELILKLTGINVDTLKKNNSADKW